ncbi:MAG: FtsW/RodA/SpoVE family cell cycle protein [Clostridia bacterium]|nr:FtsW/RodA/SpoVE family cell cycle protein [Clostridia bacterium]
MNKKVEVFLQSVCQEIRYKKIHPEIREELKLHIDDLTDEYLCQGYSKQEAISRAVLAMGNAQELGKNLNKQHKPQLGWGILLLMIAASVFGILLMCIPQYPGRQGGTIEHMLFFMALSVPVLFATYFYDYTKLKKYPWFFYFTGILLVVACSVIGKSVNGIKSYLMLGRLSVYVPGLLTVIFMISFCGFTERFRNQGVWGICKLIGLSFVSLLGFLTFPCLSYAFFLGIAYVIVLLKTVYTGYYSVNGKKNFYLLLIGFIIFGILAVVVSFMVSPHRMQRLLLFLDKGASDALNSGWLYAVSNKILSTSRWIGHALPIPEGDIGWIMPDLTEDFALLNIIGNYGWAYGVVVILIAATLIFRMFVVSFRVKYSFGKTLSLGCCILLSVQFICSILMNLGYFPIIKVTLPFISYGGSMYLINVFLVGLILSVWRRNRLLSSDHKPTDESKPKRKRITFENHKLVIDFGIKVLPMIMMSVLTIMVIIFADNLPGNNAEEKPASAALFWYEQESADCKFYAPIDGVVRECSREEYEKYGVLQSN